jgi:hypothetical protein
VPLSLRARGSNLGGLWNHPWALKTKDILSQDLWRVGIQNLKISFEKFLFGNNYKRNEKLLEKTNNTKNIHMSFLH